MKENFSWEYSLNRNTIYISEPINSQLAERVISQLFYLENRFNEDEVPSEKRIITMIINSPGGSVSDGLAIRDVMNYIDAKIETIGIGVVASMGAVLLCSGSKGYRKVTKNCEVLIHQPLGSASGQASDIIIAAKHIEKTRDKLNTILSENTGQTLKKIRQDTDRDTIMDANEALEYGLIDYVIPSINKAKGE